MKQTKLTVLLLCFALLSVFLSGCGDSANEAAADYPVMETEAAMEMEGAGVTSFSALSTISDPSAKLIRTVHLDAESKEYDALMTTLDAKITELGGYIENRDAYNGSEYNRRSRYCYMTIRIPADKLDQFITLVSENCNICNTSETVENVTLEYADTASRVEALETEQTRLLELLEAAESLEDILKIEERLSDVRYELTSYASQLRVLENQVSYSTVHLNVSEVEELTPVEEPTIWERIRDGFTDTMEDVTNGAVDLFVWLVSESPVLVIWAVVLTAATLTVRTVRRRHKGLPKQEAPAKESPPKEESAE